MANYTFSLLTGQILTDSTKLFAESNGTPDGFSYVTGQAIQNYLVNSGLLSVSLLTVSTVATANITLSVEQTLNGHTTDADAVLVVAQTDASENGVYLSAPGAWTRLAGYNEDEEIRQTLILIQEGTLAGVLYRNTNATTIVVDTTDITFETYVPNQTASETIITEATVTNLSNIRLMSMRALRYVINKFKSTVATISALWTFDTPIRLSTITSANILATDSNGDIKLATRKDTNDFLVGYNTTATATGTTTLTVDSKYQQYFTGTLGQIVVMPVVSTLSLGFQFLIVNKSTGILTINSSGGNTIISLATNCTVTLTCVAITGTGTSSWNVYVAAIPIITSGEKAVTILPTGVQTTYDLQEQIIAPGTIASADWSTGQATYTGLQGQWTVDANYKYDCIGTNLWIRTPVTEARYDMFLADIDDTSGNKSGSDLDTAYPTAQIGQWVHGTVRNDYRKRGVADWVTIPHNITTDTTYIPERLSDVTGVADNDTITIKAQYDIRSIRVVAETTTAGNISIGSVYGLTDIVDTTALPAVIGTGLRLQYIVDVNYPTLASRVLYINIDSAATVTVQIVLEKIY